MAAIKLSLRPQMTGFIVPSLDAGLIHDMACKVDLLSAWKSRRDIIASQDPANAQGRSVSIEKERIDYLSKDMEWLELHWLIVHDSKHIGQPHEQIHA